MWSHLRRSHLGRSRRRSLTALMSAFFTSLVLHGDWFMFGMWLVFCLEVGVTNNGACLYWRTVEQISPESEGLQVIQGPLRISPCRLRITSCDGICLGRWFHGYKIGVGAVNWGA